MPQKQSQGSNSKNVFTGEANRNLPKSTVLRRAGRQVLNSPADVTVIYPDRKASLFFLGCM